MEDRRAYDTDLTDAEWDLAWKPNNAQAHVHSVHVRNAADGQV